MLLYVSYLRPGAAVSHSKQHREGGGGNTTRISYQARVVGCHRATRNSLGIGYTAVHVHTVSTAVSPGSAARTTSEFCLLSSPRDESRSSIVS